MNLALKLVTFSVLLNLATGIMLTAIPAFADDPSLTGGLFYDSSVADGFTTELNTTIDTQAAAEANDNIVDRLLDKAGLGFVSKIKTAVKKYLYGFINVLEGFFGPMMDNETRIMFFGGMRWATGIAYIYTMIYWFFGKSPSKG